MPIVQHTFHGEFSKDEVLDWLGATLAANKKLKPVGIAVSNSIAQKGVSGKFEGIKIAMDPSLYPEDKVTFTFKG